MDAKSLDACVEGVLSSLYPPFEFTAPTLLGQVFSVWEQSFHGDALQYLVSFLIPAKHLLQSLQLSACANYPGKIFRHEGWPLCLGERVVLQLCDLDPLVLRSRDFYLQVVPSPSREQSPRVTLKCLSRRGLRQPRHRHHRGRQSRQRHANVLEVPCPDDPLCSLLSMEWLQGVSAERGGPPLENCVLSCPEGPVRLPWKELLQPEFVDVPRPSARQDPAAPEEGATERGVGGAAPAAAASPGGSEGKPGDGSATSPADVIVGDAAQPPLIESTNPAGAAASRACEVNRSQTCLGRRRVSPAGSTRVSHPTPGGSRGGLELTTERRDDVDDDDAVAAAAAAVNKAMVETKRAEARDAARCLHNESASAAPSDCQGAPCLVGVASSAVASSNNRKYAAVSDANVASRCRGKSQEGSHQSELVQSNLMRRGNDCQVGPHQPPISSRSHSDAGNAAAAVSSHGAASDPESYSDGARSPGARAERTVVPTRSRRLPKRVSMGAFEDARDHWHGSGEPPGSGRLPKSIFGQLHSAQDSRGGCEQASLGASLPRSEAAMAATAAAAAATQLLAATCARPGAARGSLGLTASESPTGNSTGSACGDVDEMEGRVRIFDVRTTSGGRAPRAVTERGEPNDHHSWDVSQLGRPRFHSELFNCPQTSNEGVICGPARVGLLTIAHGIPPGGIARLPRSPGEVDKVCGPPLEAAQRHRDGTDDGMALSPKPAERVRVPTEQTPLVPTADNDASPQELSAGGVGTVPAEMPAPEETESKGTRVTEKLAEREARPFTARGAFHQRDFDSAGLNESLQMSRPQPTAPAAAAAAATAVFDPPVTVSGERRAADGGSRAPAPPGGGQGRRALPADAWEGTSGDRERRTHADWSVAGAPEEARVSAAPAEANALAGAPVGDRKALWEDDEGGGSVDAGGRPSRAGGAGTERADDDDGVDELAAAAGDADGGRPRDDACRFLAGVEGAPNSRSPCADSVGRCATDTNGMGASSPRGHSEAVRASARAGRTSDGERIDQSRSRRIRSARAGRREPSTLSNGDAAAGGATGDAAGELTSASVGECCPSTLPAAGSQRLAADDARDGRSVPPEVPRKVNAERRVCDDAQTGGAAGAGVTGDEARRPAGHYTAAAAPTGSSTNSSGASGGVVLSDEELQTVLLDGDTDPTRTRDTDPTHTRDTDPTQTRDTDPTHTRDTDPTHTRDTDPTQTSDTDPTHTRDTDPTQTGDIDPTQTGDIDPTHTRDIDPTHTIDTDPTHTRDTDPTQTSDTDPTHTRDTDPTQTGDIDPTQTGDIDPTHTRDIDPTHTIDTDPTHTRDTDPTHTRDTDPTQTSDIDPTHIRDIDPTQTGDIDPTHTRDIDPTHTRDTDPTQTRDIDVLTNSDDPVPQEAVPGALHAVIVFVEREPGFRVEEALNVHYEVVTSLRSLHKHVESGQLPRELKGSFPYSHSDWLRFRRRLEPFVRDCEEATQFLHSSVEALRSAPAPQSEEEAAAERERQGRMMRAALQDERLVGLQLEGGATLARLRKESTGATASPDCRDAVERATRLYGQAEEQVHNLVMLSNACAHRLDRLLAYWPLQKRAAQMQSWLEQEGEGGLRSTDVLPDSLACLRTTHQEFQSFYARAKERCDDAADVLRELEPFGDAEPGLEQCARTARELRPRADDFRRRLESRRAHVQQAVRLYTFLDRAYAWSLERIRGLARLHSVRDAGAGRHPASEKHDAAVAVVRRLEALSRAAPTSRRPSLRRWRRWRGGWRATPATSAPCASGTSPGESVARPARPSRASWRRRSSGLPPRAVRAEGARRRRAAGSPTRSAGTRRTARRGARAADEPAGARRDPRREERESLESLVFEGMEYWTSDRMVGDPGDAGDSEEAGTPSPAPRSESRQRCYSVNDMRVDERSEPGGLAAERLPPPPPPPPLLAGRGERRLLSAPAGGPNPRDDSGEARHGGKGGREARGSFALEHAHSFLANCKAVLLRDRRRLSRAAEDRTDGRSAAADLRRSLSALESIDGGAVARGDGAARSPQRSPARSPSARGGGGFGDAGGSRQREQRLGGARPPLRRLVKVQSVDAGIGRSTEALGGTAAAVAVGLYRRDEPVLRHGNTGLYIRGLEVGSTVAVETGFMPRSASHSALHSTQQQHQQQTASQQPSPTHRRPALLRSGSLPVAPVQRRFSETESHSRGSKLRHVVAEMIDTEREYVRALAFVVEHYVPELDGPGAATPPPPPELRGRQNALFGNLRGILLFHEGYFQRELEQCAVHPLRVSHCFLRHAKQFEMYALYSKNKPRSDALLASHGIAFFRRKQLELEDKMDLASYLLKPIQRMSKYALLLRDMIKESAGAESQDLDELRAALDLVKFQLRHGNDLLAMDAIRECDVNLKEQGQLLRQEEFVVWHGRKKMQRRVFLFQELVLFSKTKRAEGVQDVYAYKSSFKTAELGLTESLGEEGLRFEIWFRRRKSSDAFVLQAPTPELKLAWTRDLSRILWQQATRNRQVRMQELSCMGVGGKPYMDIRPSAAAISDRAIDFFTRGRGTRSRASIAVSSFDHSGQTSPHRPAFLSQTGGQAFGGPYSCVGPVGGGPLVSPGRMAAATSEFQSCIQEEEDATEPETGSQPSVATASTDSLSQCTSSGSGDSGCSSRFLYDAPAEEGGAPPPLARAPLGPFPGRGLGPPGAPPSPASSGDELQALAAGRGPRCRALRASGAPEGGARYGPRGNRAEGTRWQEDDASRRNGDKKGDGFPCSPSTLL
uniref:Uncharacterized protein LOC116955990 n=1 Tax=Petromyzon marinus TaxID=7757 RepID=A0AAJ7UEE7_PETMA|nr:uncharacterized protein LOC116955990 [Petromyzon marinus]